MGGAGRDRAMCLQAKHPRRCQPTPAAGREAGTGSASEGASLLTPWPGLPLLLATPSRKPGFPPPLPCPLRPPWAMAGPRVLSPSSEPQPGSGTCSHLMSQQQPNRSACPPPSSAASRLSGQTPGLATSSHTPPRPGPQHILSALPSHRPQPRPAAHHPPPPLSPAPATSHGPCSGLSASDAPPAPHPTPTPLLSPQAPPAGSHPQPTPDPTPHLFLTTSPLPRQLSHLYLGFTPASCSHPRTWGSVCLIPHTLPAPTASAHKRRSEPLALCRSHIHQGKLGSEGPLSLLPNQESAPTHSCSRRPPAGRRRPGLQARLQLARVLSQGTFPGGVGGPIGLVMLMAQEWHTQYRPPGKVSVGRYPPPQLSGAGRNPGLRTGPHGLVPARWAHGRPSNKVGALRSGGKVPGAGGVCAHSLARTAPHLCPRSHPGLAGLGHSPPAWLCSLMVMRWALELGLPWPWDSAPPEGLGCWD